MLDAMNSVLEELAKEGRCGYVIPGGGSNPIGATGYVACAQEIQNQLFTKGIDIDRLVTATGSTGTQAGLIVGFSGCNMNIPIVGIGVSRDQDVQEEMVFSLAEQCADYVGVKGGIPRAAVTCFGDYWRPQYSVPNRKMVEAVNLLAKSEGILLDPVYTGKAMAGLIDLSRKGYFKKGERILFLHTGGSPALYAYMKAILGEESVSE
jgi:D-cysteine desulfhydrase